MLTHRTRLERLEAQARATVQPVANPVAALLQIGMTEREVEIYCHLCDLAREAALEVNQAFGVTLADPEGMKRLLARLASLPEAVVKRLTLEEILERGGGPSGLTMPEVLARADGPALLAVVADDFFADREGADHADVPDPA